VLWNSDGTLRVPGSTSNTIPLLTHKRTVATTTHYYTTNYDPDPMNQGASETASQIFPNATYGTASYKINYDAILYWLTNTGPNPFPAQLRAGGILYYSSIPTTVGTPSGNMPTATQANRDARFWKEYIDYVCGLIQNPDNSWSVISMYTGYGDFVAASNKDQGSTSAFPLTTPGASDDATTIYPKPFTQTVTTRYYTNYNSLQTVTSFTLQDTRYMDYRDCPLRPITQYWFGPLTMIDFMYNFNCRDNTTTGNPKFWWPGTAHQAPLWQLKTGVQSAVGDVQKNHANDYLSVIGFSVPTWSPDGGTTINQGYYNAVRAPLGQNYFQIIDSLWYPPYILGKITRDTNGNINNLSSLPEITPYNTDSSGNSVPNAMASVPLAVNGTCSPFSMMLAYNQFSGDSGTRTFAGASGTAGYGMAGGLGRNGSQKLIIFETDGVASTLATGPNLDPASSSQLVANGANSYFKMRWTDTGTPEYPNWCYGPAADAVTQTEKMADLITNYSVNPTTGAALTNPGFATPRKPVLIHCIAFGSLFYSGNTAGGYQATALGELQYLQYKGGTQSSASTALPASKIINQTTWDDGSSSTVVPPTSRKNAMQQAFSTALQDGVGVVLIR